MLVNMGSWKQDHILNDFPPRDAHMIDLKIILAEISFLLGETGHICLLGKKEVVSMKISGCK